MFAFGQTKIWSVVLFSENEVFFCYPNQTVNIEQSTICERPWVLSEPKQTYRSFLEWTKKRPFTFLQIEQHLWSVQAVTFWFCTPKMIWIVHNLLFKSCGNKRFSHLYLRGWWACSAGSWEASCLWCCGCRSTPPGTPRAADVQMRGDTNRHENQHDGSGSAPIGFRSSPVCWASRRGCCWSSCSCKSRSPS